MGMYAIEFYQGLLWELACFYYLNSGQCRQIARERERALGYSVHKNVYVIILNELPHNYYSLTAIVWRKCKRNKTSFAAVIYFSNMSIIPSSDFRASLDIYPECRFGHAYTCSSK